MGRPVRLVPAQDPDDELDIAPREVELKLDVADAAIPSLRQTLDRLAGPARTRRLHSVYWDTDDGALRRAGLGLRIREVDGLRMQTVKADDGGLFDRSEWEAPAGDAPNLEAAPPLRSALKGAGVLRPQFENRVERSEWLIERDGARIEAALDVGEVETAGRRAPILQLELELKAGEPVALFRLAETLAVETPLRLTFETKAEQGFRLAAGQPPSAVKAERPRLDRSMTVAQALMVVAGAALRQTVANDRPAGQFRRPEGVHQMRVGLRRLRSALALFRPPEPDTAYDHLRAELKWLAGQLGPARDLDVFIGETFRPAADALGAAPGLAAFGKRVKRAQTRAYDRLVKALDSPRARTIPLATAAWLETGINSQPSDWRDLPVLAFAEAALERLRRKVRKLAEAETAEARHDLRIAAKKLRYALDGFDGLFPEKAVRRYRKRTADLQARLGVLNDLATARRVALEALGPTPTADVAFAAGLVVGRRAVDEAALIAVADKDVKALLRCRRPWRT